MRKRGKYGVYTDLPADFKPPVIGKKRLDEAIKVAENTPGFTDLSWLKQKLNEKKDDDK
jgi:hypothetical protein